MCRNLIEDCDILSGVVVKVSVNLYKLFVRDWVVIDKELEEICFFGKGIIIILELFSMCLIFYL